MIDIRLKKLASSLINCGSNYWQIENAIKYSKLEGYEKRYLLCTSYIPSSMKLYSNYL